MFLQLMRLIKIFSLNFFLFFCLESDAHSPENFIIAEIEQGQISFENEIIAKEYEAALKRLRIRRISSMSFIKKFSIFTKAGFEHIIPKGLDHILFVLGLFFSCLKFKSLLIQVTSFTIAHSITLFLAAIGIFQLSGSITEPLIALSIVWIGVENCIFKEPKKWRAIIVFLFGLLHGLGFASVLSYYGLPKDNFISLLLAFNIGVEIGQLAILILAYILINMLFRKNWKDRKIRIAVSIIIAAVGSFWFVERIV
ncbi:MAG: hypothetical protein CMP65_05475 [Flavobacteriales bacterium]|nr:hypothetical protein [Flavobacteriales bacterium]